MHPRSLPTNGVCGITGRYLVAPPTTREILSRAMGRRIDPQEYRELCDWNELYAPDPEGRGPKAGVDPLELAETGWAVVFAEGVTLAEREALGPLLRHRESRANAFAERYREITYRHGETKNQFLERHKVGPGPADPDKLPYFILLVGSPGEIPYRFQYQLDVQYAVGRIHFRTRAEYANYAKGVVETETRPPNELGATFFGVRNPDDPATASSADHLVRPLAATLGDDPGHWNVETLLAENATRASLLDRIGGPSPPQLLVTASHGIAFPDRHPEQDAYQGALLCQEWPGPKAWKGPLERHQFLAGEDIGDDAHPAGLIAFFFACFGAGTPRLDDFADPGAGPPNTLAEDPFLSQLPRRLLGHPRGGALAVISHIDRAWGHSFLWERTGRQHSALESMLRRLLAGDPVGVAMEPMNQRHAELAVDLAEEVEAGDLGDPLDPDRIARLWTAHRDARNYVVLGDPAVRCVVTPPPQAVGPDPEELT